MLVQLYLWRTQDYTNLLIRRSTVAIQLELSTDHSGNESSWYSVITTPLL